MFRRFGLKKVEVLGQACETRPGVTIDRICRFKSIPQTFALRARLVWETVQPTIGQLLVSQARLQLRWILGEVVQT
jgi:hypothetical protein